MEVGELQGTEMGFVCDKPYVVFSLFCGEAVVGAFLNDWLHLFSLMMICHNSVARPAP